jgi:hypothetical protein
MEGPIACTVVRQNGVLIIVTATDTNFVDKKKAILRNLAEFCRISIHRSGDSENQVEDLFVREEDL